MVGGGQPAKGSSVYHQQCSLNVYSSTGGFIWRHMLSPWFIHIWGDMGL